MPWELRNMWHDLSGKHASTIQIEIMVKKVPTQMGYCSPKTSCKIIIK